MQVLEPEKLNSSGFVWQLGFKTRALILELVLFWFPVVREKKL